MGPVTRFSRIAYVLIRVAFGGDIYSLLRWHAKWDDWSLIGGHVEHSEIDDWLATARREANEEMTPLVIGRDIEVAALERPSTRFVKESKAAAGAVTEYEVRWYALEFLADPVRCLQRLDCGAFVLVNEQGLARHASVNGKQVSDVVHVALGDAILLVEAAPRRLIEPDLASVRHLLQTS
jgi:uncharacterized protein (UPF0216 family)